MATAVTNGKIISSFTDVFQIFLEDEDGQNILSIDDGALRQSLQIHIVNTSGKNIEFKKIKELEYHFCISFRPGTLLLSEDENKKIKLKKENELNGWQIIQDKDNFYLRQKNSDFYINNREPITLTLENIGASPAGGSRGTRVEVKYDNLKYKNSEENISGNRLLYLNIVNQRGKKQVPLYSGFLGSNTILNDGTENTLVLTIQNIPRQNISFDLIDKTSVNIKENNIYITRWQDNLLLFIKEKIPQFENINKKFQTDNISAKSKSFFALISKLLQEISTNTDSNSFESFKTKVTELSLENKDKKEIIEKLIDNLGIISQNDLNTISLKVKELFSLDDLSFINQIIQNSKSLQVIQSELNQQGEFKFQGYENEVTLDQVTKFTISFDVTKTDNNSKHWALLEKTNADDVQISILSGQEKWVFGGKEEQGITPQWNFLCKQGLSLKNDERQEILRLNISNLKTTLLSGYANLYMHYENIPGYWDGYITVPIHKGPLVYRECIGSDKLKVGCVGIGTDEPQAKLHVKKNSKLALALKVEGDTAIAGNLAVTSGKVGIGITPDSQQSEQLKIQGNTAIQGNLAVTSGKVAIGIAPNPQQSEQLKIQGNTAIAGKLDITDNINIAQNKEIYFNDNGKIRSFDNNHQIIFNRSQNQMEFREYGKLIFSTGATGTSRMVILDDGKVGIGITNPETKLHVQGDTAIAGNLAVTSGKVCIETNNPQIHLAIGDNDTGIRWNSDGDISIMANNQERIKITPDNVVIKGKISVEGAIWSNQYGNKWQKIKESTLVINQPRGLWEESDIQLKKETSPISNVLSQIEQLKPVSFYWQNLDYFLNKFDEDNPDSSMLNEEELEFLNQEREIFKANLEKQQFGFIAQDLEAVFPDWVSTGESGYKQINLRMLPSFLVGAIQELSRKYDELVIENQKLNQRLKTLENPN
jgi:hypothetical protein